MTEANWIAVDWGTSNLRAFLMDESGQIIDRKSSPCGMGKLNAGQFEPALLELIHAWLTDGRQSLVLSCGMVGARQGWCEQGYREVPCSPIPGLSELRARDGAWLRPLRADDPRISVRIMPGLSQARPADVMRGEETQIAGLLSVDPSFSGSVCLPGTHSKWVVLHGGEVKRFQTFMTGELFSILSRQSILRHSVLREEIDPTQFLEVAKRVLENPLVPVSEMFSLRAASLLGSRPSGDAYSHLTGMLVGQEIAAAREYWTGRPTMIIGEGEIAGLYRKLLLELGANVSTLPATRATVAGLGLVAGYLKEIPWPEI